MASSHNACSLQKRTAQPTLVMRTRTMVEALPVLVGQAMGAAATQLRDHGQRPAGPPFVAYHNEDMSDLDVEVGFPIEAPFEATGAFTIGEIPGGTYAACLHIGPYSDVGSAYETLAEWVDGQGFVPTGVIYEIYLNDPEQTPPEALRTEILYPLTV